MRRIFIARNRKAQVWVETVLYTLIGLAIIGIVLAVAKPKIDEMKDKMLIEQSIESMNKIDNKIYEVQRATGNQRKIDMKISNGKFVIDSENNSLFWILESDYKYSEPDIVVESGKMNILTEEASPWKVTLSINYPVDLRYNNQTIGIKEFEAAPSPYTFYIKNKGSNNGNLIIDISE
ncbi:MAG: hypothetical protein ACP5D2_00595 [Candidatus Nanoarchaeia archaeon]